MESVTIEADLAARLWRDSGCQAITEAGVHVPGRVVTGVTAMVARLDAVGAGLADEFGAAGLGILAERAAALGLGRAGQTSCNGASRFVAARDGWIAVTLARQDDRALLPAWLGIDPAAPCVHTESRPWSDVERHVAGLDVSEIVERAELLGVACSAVGGTTAAAPATVERIGFGSPRELGGLRVINLGALWAGPLCAEVLTRLGADVVTVESTARPDGARATPHWFDAIHAGQRSVALDFRTASGRSELCQLLAASDVVIESSRPRALAQLGIDARQIVAEGRPAVWISITGHGRDEANARRVGLGDDCAAEGGLVGWSAGGQPRFLGDAIADPITGLVAAASVLNLLASGIRAVVDVALSRVAAVFASRIGDPVTRPLAVESPPTSPRRGADPFLLGANNVEVRSEWLA